MNRLKYMALMALICCGSRVLAMGQPPRLERQVPHGPGRNLFVVVDIDLAIAHPAYIEDIANVIATPEALLANPDRYFATMTRQYLEEFLNRNHAEHALTLAQALHSRIEDGSISSSRKVAILDAINNRMQQAHDDNLIDEFARFLLTIDPPDAKSAANKK